MSGIVFEFIKILGNENSTQIFTVAKFTPNNYVRGPNSPRWPKSPRSVVYAALLANDANILVLKVI